MNTSSNEIQQIIDGIICQCGCTNEKTDLFCRNCGASLNIDKRKAEDDYEEI